MGVLRVVTALALCGEISQVLGSLSCQKKSTMASQAGGTSEYCHVSPAPARWDPFMAPLPPLQDLLPTFQQLSQGGLVSPLPWSKFLATLQPKQSPSISLPTLQTKAWRYVRRVVWSVTGWGRGLREGQMSWCDVGPGAVRKPWASSSSQELLFYK